MKKMFLITSVFLLISCSYYKEKKLFNHLESIKNSSSAEMEAEEIALLHKYIGKNAIYFTAVAYTSSNKEISFPNFFRCKDIESVDIDFYISNKDTVHFKNWKPKNIDNFFYLYNE